MPKTTRVITQVEVNPQSGVLAVHIEAIAERYRILFL
jgi:hypothetical protein